MYKYIEPEVGGGLGTETQIDTSVNPPIIHFLHLHLQGWLGSDLLECTPCFMVTERLKNAFEMESFSGISFSDMKVTLDEDFPKNMMQNPMPKFFRLNVSGKAGIDDFGIAKDLRLVVSERAQNFLNQFDLTRATYAQYK